MRAAHLSIALQAVGSASTFATGAIVASFLGFAAQGEFSLLKSWSDGFITAATFGMPQAFLHFQYREGVAMPDLLRFLKRYVLGVAGLIAAVVAILGAIHWTTHASATTALKLPQVAVLAAGIPLATAHALLRSLTLKRSLLRFSALTAAPAVLLLLNLLAAIVLGWRPRFEWLITGSALVSMLAAYAAIQDDAPKGVPSGISSASLTRQLWSISLQTGTQNVIAAFTPALLLGTATLRGATLHEIGRVSLGLYVYQAFAVLATYAGPLIYDRAARKEKHRVFDALGTRQRLILWLVGASVLLAFLVPAVLTALGDQHAALGWTISLNAAAGACALLVRTLWSVMQAQGAFAMLSRQAVVRVLISVPLLVVLMIRLPAVFAVPLVLLIGELTLIGWFLVMIKSETSPLSTPRSLS
jgi:hypothetical protein